LGVANGALRPGALVADKVVEHDAAAAPRHSMRARTAFL